MARKHLLSNIGGMRPAEASIGAPSEARAEYARRGASRSMMQSLDEMAENSIRFLEGEAIVQLDPDSLDPSPFRDRIGEDDEQYQALRNAIERAGQSSPILVRPNPEVEGRHIIVFGHRRTKVAKELGTTVRAIIKPLEEINYVISQGQENTARAGLTFIEKSLFAKTLQTAGISKEDIKTALTVDDTLLSRMLAVAEQIPGEVLEAIGAARGIGRDRWEHLKKIVLHPSKAAEAVSLIRDGLLDDVPTEERFSAVVDALSKSKQKKPASSRPTERTWALAENAVKVATKDAGRSFTIAVKSKDASGFGAYLSDNLERLYREFQERSET